jgi:hypothetical protein
MDDASNLPFSEIELSKDERKMLKALADSRIFATDDIFQTANRLKHFGLANLHPIPSKEGVPVLSFGTSCAIGIEERGKDYLAYIDQRKKATKANRIHDLVIAIISFLLGLLTSEHFWNFLSKCLSGFEG